MIEPDLTQDVQEAALDEPQPEKKEKLELQLVIWPDPRLKDPVPDFPEEHLGDRVVKNTAGAMIRAMYKHEGIGLAAPQMGVPFGIFVMDENWHAPDQKKHPRVFLNPKITDVEREGAIEMARPGEGCLSFPYNYRNPVRRYARVELQYLDFKGEVHHEWFKGHGAIIVQHEVDHLMGLCFIDRLSKMKQDMAYRRARKIRRHYGQGYKKMIRQMKNAPHTKEYALKNQQMFEAGLRSVREEKSNDV